MVHIGVVDSDEDVEAFNWWRFAALPGLWHSSADLWGTNLELR